MDKEEEESERQLQRLETAAINSRATDRVASIIEALVIFARIQMALSRRAHKQTRKVIILTWAIALLTVALLLFTIYLSYDAYLKTKGHEEQYRYRSEQNDSPRFDP
jgi:hypothetical protein